MAFAFIDLGGQDGDSVELLAQLGDSPYFEYRIGRSERPDLFGGVPLEEEAHRSELFRRRGGRSETNGGGAREGFLPWDQPEALALRIPRRLFSREYSQVQVVGFRDAAKNGPVFSQVLRVMSHGIDTSAYDRGLPGRAMSRSGFAEQIGLSHPTRRISLGFSESRLSHALFVDSLLGALETLAPSLLESLPALLEGLQGGDEGEDGNGESPSGLDVLGLLSRLGQSALGSEGINLGNLDLGGLDLGSLDLSGLGLEGADTEGLVNLLQQLAGAFPDAAATSESGSNTTAGGIAELPPPPAAPSTPSAGEGTTPGEGQGDADTAQTADQLSLRARQWSGQAAIVARARRARADRRARLGVAMNTGLHSRAGLATLLAPFLQRSPQLISVLGDRPLDLLGTLLRAQLASEAPVGGPGPAMVRDWCRHSNGNDLVGELLRRSVLPALAAQQSATNVTVRPVERAHLAFLPGRGLQVAGREKSVYDASRTVTLRAQLQFQGPTPQGPLERAIARVRFIDPSLSRAVLEKEYQLRNVRAGDPLTFTLEVRELEQVPRGRDLHVEASLRWPTPRGVVSVRGDHAIVLGEGLLFAGLGRRTGQERLLADPSAYRHFWTKVWEGGTDTEGQHSRWELDASCRFYVRVTGAAPTNGRMETRMMIEPRSEGNTLTWQGRLRSGMEISLSELNALESTPLLTPEELDALRGADLRNQLDLSATTKLKVRGKERATGTVWAFVSVQRRELSFLELVGSNEDGQVEGVTEFKRELPFPSSVHFLTMRTK